MTAKNKQANGKRHAKKGIAVGNRFRVDAYFETREQIARIDRCADKARESRSKYVSNATIQRIERDEADNTNTAGRCAR